MIATAVLTCCVNSHPFQERRLSLSEPFKIGRSVAQARPGLNNAIFDCKVLSRNHALIWYENGKFYLQDTKSSNGTFVNSQRLSKGSEESTPHEIFSNDMLQFGVDVVENSRKGTTMHQITHSCIIASVQLFHPDGQEALQSASDADSISTQSNIVHSQDLHCLSQYIQEALRREQMLESKISTLQELVTCIQDSTDIGWQAMIDEDRFLSRLEILETQLNLTNKDIPEDVLKQRLTALENEKYQYELTVKDSLKMIYDEKLDAFKKLSDLELTLKLANEEIENLEKLKAADADRFEELNSKIVEQNTDILNLQNKLEMLEKANAEKSNSDKDVQVDNISLLDLKRLNEENDDDDDDDDNNGDNEGNNSNDKKLSKIELSQMHDESMEVKRELLRLAEEKAILQSKYDELYNEKQIFSLQENKKIMEVSNMSSSIYPLMNQNLETSLNLDESKSSAEKEKIRELQEELTNIHEEYNILSYQTKIVSFASALPLVLLILAFILSFHQFFSTITATTAKEDL